MSDVEPIFQGECQLVGWSDSSSRGKTCTLRFNDLEHDAHPLKLYRPGARLAVVMVWINDDETPAKPKKERKPEEIPAKPEDAQYRVQRPSNLAAILCNDKDFYMWVNEGWWGVNLYNESTAKEWMCDLLDIESRSQLDKDQALNDRFRDCILIPFSEWRDNVLKVK